jgi:hypothetical protein
MFSEVVRGNILGSKAQQTTEGIPWLTRQKEAIIQRWCKK